ncbi:MAG: hypothetical protein RMA76_32925 [Deltaproteobacteria bacterium]|jgi:hypothetical protein
MGQDPKQPELMLVHDDEGIEWLGGIASLPELVRDEVPYHPSVLMWLGPSDLILGSVIDHPDRIWDRVVESFRQAIDAPLAGEPGAPSQVRVASRPLAAMLREAFPDVRVVRAPTPELDAVFAGMFEHMTAQTAEEVEASYLDGGLEAELIERFFEVSAALYRTKPWTVARDEDCPFLLGVDALGIEDAFVTVLGGQGEAYGLLIFESADDFDAFADAASGVMAGGEPGPLPPYMALNFERGADMPKSLREEIARHGWGVAGAKAYPWLAVTDEGGSPVPPTDADVTLAMAAARAVTDAMKDPAALRVAWDGGTPAQGTLGRQVGARVRWRAVDPAELFDEPFDPLLVLDTLEAEGQLDSEVRTEVEMALVAAFASSPEAKKCTRVAFAGTFMDIAARVLEQTVVSMDAATVAEVLEEGFARHVTVQPTEAAAIVAEMRAFYRYLGRAYDLEQADACVRKLQRMKKRLEVALADTSKYAPSKAAVMRGFAAGYDVSTPEGAAAWMEKITARPSKGSRSPSKNAKAKAKSKRKASRKARKKGR